MTELNYIDIFITNKTSADLIKMKLFPNAKEISESMSCYYAIINNIPVKQNDPAVNIVVVGDGSNPRTGSLMAVKSAWNVISVDPRMKIIKKYELPRLKLYKNKIDDITLDFGDETVIIVSPHSHAKLSVCLKSIMAKVKHVVSLPCCFKDDIGVPDITYTDNCVFSPKNIVNIYLNR